MARSSAALQSARSIAAAVTVCALTCLVPGELRAQSESAEYAVKATYLYKLAPFITWPGEAFTSPTSPLVLCIAGDDPFGSMLDRAVRGQTADQRPIELRRLGAAQRDAGCHILYIAGSSAQPVAQALAEVRGTPVLTVTDSAGAKGIINFVIAENRVRFEIDLQRAADMGLAISSKLLSLAVSVRGRT